jgi:hypothetical protein
MTSRKVAIAVIARVTIGWGRLDSGTGEKSPPAAHLDWLFRHAIPTIAVGLCD